MLLDYDIFEHVPMLDAKDVKTVQKLYDAKDLDFRLKPGSAAVDKGTVIPNVTDGYSGDAPDLGALELGKPCRIMAPAPEASRSSHRTIEITGRSCPRSLREKPR